MSRSTRNLGDLDKHAFKEDENDKTVVYRRVCDEAGNALLEDILEALQNGGGTGGSGRMTCQKIPINLTADTWVCIPHSYNNDVCDWKILDSNNNEFEICWRYNPTTLKLEAMSNADINNALIVLEGEL